MSAYRHGSVRMAEGKEMEKEQRRTKWVKSGSGFG